LTRDSGQYKAAESAFVKQGGQHKQFWEINLIFGSFTRRFLVFGSGFAKQNNEVKVLFGWTGTPGSKVVGMRFSNRPFVCCHNEYH